MKPNENETANLLAILEKTTNSRDPKSLFLRIETFICIGRNQDALDCIKKESLVLEKDVERLLPLHIELLLAFQDYDGAYEAVKHYAELPYVNQAVEEMLKEYPTKIRKIEKKTFAKTQPDTTTLKRQLTQKDPASVLIALQTVAHLGYQPFIKEIKAVLSSDLNDYVRTFALLVLVDGKYMEEVKFSKNGIDFTVVPENLDPPFEGPDFDDFIHALQTHGEDPSILSIAEEIFRQYVMAIYPEEALGTADDLLIEALILLAHRYLAADIDLKKVSKRSGFPSQKIEALAQIIDEMTQKTPKIDI